MLKGKENCDFGFGFCLAFFNKKVLQITVVQRYHSQTAHSYSNLLIIPFGWIGYRKAEKQLS